MAVKIAPVSIHCLNTFYTYVRSSGLKLGSIGVAGADHQAGRQITAGRVSLTHLKVAESLDFKNCKFDG